MAWVTGLPSGDRNAVIADIRDLLPTILDSTDVADSETVAGRKVAIIEGRRLMPAGLNAQQVAFCCDAIHLTAAQQAERAPEIR